MFSKQNQNSESPVKTNQESLRTKIFFRIGAIIVGFLCVVVLELLLRAIGVPPLPLSDDPYVSFSGSSPLFELDESQVNYHIAENRLTYFRLQSFPAKKSNGTFRVFVLGGSTVQGRPYAVETAFSSWLQINLKAAQPDRKFEVINCGGVSYASYRLVPILREVLNYKPDLLIVYSGHNEFLEARTYSEFKNASEKKIAARLFLKNLRLGTLFQNIIPQKRKPTTKKNSAPELPEEVDAQLDYDDGLEKYHRDPDEQAAIVKHFGFNIRQMVLLAKQAKVPIILIDPVSNLRNSPPFKSEFASSLNPSDKENLLKLWKQAQDLEWEKVDNKIDLMEQAVAIDSHHAGLLYDLGRTHYFAKNFAAAEGYLQAALEEDICPLRMIRPLHSELYKVINEFNTPYLNARVIIEQQSTMGIPGNDLLIDHVHPNIEGHQLIADGLFHLIVELNLATTSLDWKKRRYVLREQQMESLDDSYFPIGASRLRGLKSWSRKRQSQTE